MRDHKDIVRTLLDSGALAERSVRHDADEFILGETSQGNWTALHFAAYYDGSHAAELLISRCPRLISSTTSSGHTPLQFAVFKSNLLILEAMGQEPVDASYSNTDARTAATGTTGESKGNVARSRATNSGAQELKQRIVMLFTILDNKTSEGRTALHVAAGTGSTEAAKFLLERGAAPNLTDNDGKAAIHFAVLSKSNPEEIVRFLLPYVNVELRDGEGKTALHHAVLAPNDGLLKLMLECGCDPQATSHAGVTPLFLAVKAGKADMVRRLMEKGAKVDTRHSSDGYTPLHVAAFEGRNEIVASLISYGAHVNATNI